MKFVAAMVNPFKASAADSWDVFDSVCHEEAASMEVPFVMQNTKLATFGSVGSIGVSANTAETQKKDNPYYFIH